MGFVSFRGSPYPPIKLRIHKRPTRVLLQMETKLINERIIKVVILGHVGSGKRSFLYRILHNKYIHSLPKMITFTMESSHEQRGEESIIWIWVVVPGTEHYQKNCLHTLQDAEAVIICRDVKAEDEDDETFFRSMKEQVRQYTQHASIFAVYTKNDRESMEYEPYPPNLLKGIHTLGLTSAKLNTGFEGLTDKLFTNLPPLPYRISVEEEEEGFASCCCFM